MAPKRLIVLTFALFVLLLVVGCFFTKEANPDAIALKIEGQPTLGYSKAKVHVVVFEEPKCINCREFHKEMFPLIKKDFIDTGKITYTTIPVSFLPNSMPAAVALLCAYYQDPLYPNNELFFSYIDHIYTHIEGEKVNWATTDKLVKFASETSPAINLSKLEKCIEHETYRVQIEKNNAYAKSIMGGVISTPRVYINGIRVETLNYNNVKGLINQQLEKEGAN